MKKICVVHSSSTVCDFLQRTAKNYLLSTHVFNPLTDVSYFDFVFQHQPTFIFLEDAGSHGMNSVMQKKLNVLSPSSELFLITSDVSIRSKEITYIQVVEDNCLNNEVPFRIQELFAKHMEHEISKYTFLTETEQQLLLLLMQGNSPRKISVLMKRKYNTIRKHVQHIYEKTNIHHYKSFQ